MAGGDDHQAVDAPAEPAFLPTAFFAEAGLSEDARYGSLEVRYGSLEVMSEWAAVGGGRG